MTRGRAVGRIVAAFLIALGLGWPLAAEASASRELSFRPDLFATAPRMDLPSLTQQLRVIEERRIAASECVALCELAAGIEAHPFGVAALEPLNRSEDAWGNYRFSSELETSNNRFGFTGHYWDKEASLYYAKARYYDPFTARFTQSDSFLGNIDNPPSLHRYLYAAANPTFFVDLDGHALTEAQKREFFAQMKTHAQVIERTSARAALVGGTVMTGGALGTAAGVGIAGTTAIGAGGGFTVGYGNARIDGATHDEAVDSGNIGALQGSIAGAFSYAGGLAASTWATARQWSGKAVGTVSAAASGFIGDLAAQGTMIASGLQEKYDATMGLFNTALGGALGRRAATDRPSTPTTIEETPRVARAVTPNELLDPSPVAIDQMLTRLPVRGPKLEKTSGTLIMDNGGSLDLVSGVQGPAEFMPTKGYGFNPKPGTRTHVEGHAAAAMRLSDSKRASLFINNPPCPGPLGCDAQLPNMLPPDARLTVFGPAGFRKDYVGKADVIPFPAGQGPLWQPSPYGSFLFRRGRDSEIVH